ncbi:hypothetical protein, partial [Eisenbergiella porci]|uniref:hypothetical protein n=1 Tax=Eisenbergiella porci TaxID=2652274 RepID=UPI002A835367
EQEKTSPPRDHAKADAKGCGRGKCPVYETAKIFLTTSAVAFTSLLSYNVECCFKIHFNK